MYWVLGIGNLAFCRPGRSFSHGHTAWNGVLIVILFHPLRSGSEGQVGDISIRLMHPAPIDTTFWVMSADHWSYIMLNVEFGHNLNDRLLYV